jgi:formylglycine-generating enzyme required for sulfatase activity
MIGLAAVVIVSALGVAVTQNLWGPRLEAYQRYGRFAYDDAILLAEAPGQTFQECELGSGDCPVMVVIPAGRFLMGSTEDNPENLPLDEHNLLYNPEALDRDEAPLREIAVARFAVSQYEITYDDWAACVNAGGCRRNVEPEDNGRGRGRRPVPVSWNDAQEYLQWLSQKTGRAYRLLTEAEWEYAARAQTDIHVRPTRFSWGDEDPVCEPEAPNGSAAVCPQLAAWPVGSFQPNAFGLYDMHGNLYEWVQDCYARYDAARATSGAVESGAPEVMTDGTCNMRVVRGGGSGGDAGSARSASRSYFIPTGRLGLYGFRIARSLEGAQPPARVEADADHQIVAGRSIGRIALGASRADVEQAMGAPEHSGSAGDRTFVGWGHGVRGSLTVYFRDGRVDQIASSSEDFMTTDGLKMGSSEVLMRHRLGNPSSTFSVALPNFPNLGITYHCYPNGLVFETMVGSVIRTTIISPDANCRMARYG